MIKLISLLETTSKGYTIYCDLDGVLCDFDNAFKKISKGQSFEKYANANSTADAWKLIHDKGSEWWANLDWMPDGKDLWKMIKKYNPIILSAPSQDPSSLKGKKQWVQKNLGNVKAIYVPAKDKQNYASPENILIDDFIKNIDQWQSKGGIPIHHINYSNTIKKLKPYL